MPLLRYKLKVKCFLYPGGVNPLISGEATFLPTQNGARIFFSKNGPALEFNLSQELLEQHWVCLYSSWCIYRHLSKSGTIKLNNFEIFNNILSIFWNRIVCSLAPRGENVNKFDIEFDIGQFVE